MPVIPGGGSDVEEEAMATVHKTALCCAELKAKPKSSPDKRKLQAHQRARGCPRPAGLVWPWSRKWHLANGMFLLENPQTGMKGSQMDQI